MHRRPAARLLLSPLLVALAAACGRTESATTPAAPDASDRPRCNVLLVTLDTTRADALGCYGGPAWASPTLDALAARGVRFTQARAVAPITLPSHASIMTGNWPFQHGVRDNGTFVLGDGARTLAERLKEAGFATAAIPAAFVVAASFGLAQGFDLYDDLAQSEAAIGGEGESRDAADVADRALRFLAAHDPARPFFLWLHFFDAHFPYQAPADLVASHPFVEEAPKKGKGPVRARNRHAYELEVANVDRALARVLAALGRFGGAESALIAVVGDHGEGLGDHGEATHSKLAYDSTLRVPLLLAGAALPKGRVVDEPVSGVDVAPTLLALAGVAHDGMSGADLAPLVAGGALAGPRMLYFENCATWFSSGWAPLYGVVDGRWKAIAGPTLRLFDLVADPDEQHDVADAHADVVERARARLSELADQTLATTRYAPGSAELAELRRLGYLTTTSSARRDGLAPPGWQPKSALTPEQGIENERRFTQSNQLWQQGRKDEAIEQLVALAREEPENAHYAEVAASLLFELGRAADALPLAEHAVELAQNVANRTTLALCRLAVGAKERALQELESTVNDYPRVPAVRLRFVQLALDLGRPELARPHLDELLKSLPPDSPLRRQAEQLDARARR